MKLNVNGEESEYFRYQGVELAANGTMSHGVVEGVCPLIHCVCGSSSHCKDRYFEDKAVLILGYR